MIRFSLLSAILLISGTILFAQENKADEKKCFTFEYKKTTHYVDHWQGENPKVLSVEQGPFSEKECNLKQGELVSSEEHDGPWLLRIERRVTSSCECSNSDQDVSGIDLGNDDSHSLGSNDHTRNKLNRLQHLFEDQVHEEMLANLDSLPSNILLQDIECNQGNCTFSWEAVDEYGKIRDLNEQERQAVQEYYMAVQQGLENKSLEEEREQLETAKKAEVATDIANLLIDGINDISKTEKGTELFIDSDGDKIADTKVTISEDGEAIYEPFSKPELNPEVPANLFGYPKVNEAADWILEEFPELQLDKEDIWVSDYLLGEGPLQPEGVSGRALLGIQVNDDLGETENYVNTLVHEQLHHFVSSYENYMPGVHSFIDDFGQAAQAQYNAGKNNVSHIANSSSGLAGINDQGNPTLTYRGGWAWFKKYPELEPTELTHNYSKEIIDKLWMYRVVENGQIIEVHNFDSLLR